MNNERVAKLEGLLARIQHNATAPRTARKVAEVIASAEPHVPTPRPAPVASKAPISPAVAPKASPHPPAVTTGNRITTPAPAPAAVLPRIPAARQSAPTAPAPMPRVNPAAATTRPTIASPLGFRSLTARAGVKPATATPTPPPAVVSPPAPKVEERSPLAGAIADAASPPEPIFAAPVVDVGATPMDLPPPPPLESAALDEEPTHQVLKTPLVPPPDDHSFDDATVSRIIPPNLLADMKREADTAEEADVPRSEKPLAEIAPKPVHEDPLPAAFVEAALPPAISEAAVPEPAPSVPQPAFSASDDAPSKFVGEGAKPAKPKRSWGLAIVALLALLVGSAVFFWMRQQQAQKPPPPPKRSQPTATATATAAATAEPTAEPTAVESGAVPSADASGSASADASGAVVGEPPPKDPKKLPATIGYLKVETALEGANVFIFTKDLGKANAWVEAPCGSQFIRLGKPEANGPRWMAAGKTVSINCQDTTTTTGAP